MRIGDSAFSDCENLVSIIIPDSVCDICWGAFERCYNLVSITMPAGLSSIGSCAFEECQSLKTVILHDNLTQIGDSAFFDAVAKSNDTLGDDHTQTAEVYKEKYRAAHTPKDVNSSRFILGGCSLDGIVGVECPVALAVASFVYGSPENSVEIEFTRDKWEYRGDYCSSYFIAFELSKDYPEGRVFKSLQYIYSNM